MIANDQLQLGRAKNAVMFFLERNLIVPKIFVDADWGGQNVDILAIDRDGVGDVHVVLFFALRYLQNWALDDNYEWKMQGELMDRLASITANYKYVGMVDPMSDLKLSPFNLISRINDKSFSPDGLGRVGFLKIDVPLEGEPLTRLEIKPERFRAKIAKLADEYVQQHEADWEIRA